MGAPLDFLRGLRIKNAIENPMSRTLFRISLPAFSIGLLFLVTGCGEDPRFSARTQYLGGVYGNAEGGPPRDTVSYWDGDNAGGSPSVKISLGAVQLCLLALFLAKSGSQPTEEAELQRRNSKPN